jgi:hypothetical protein
MPSNSTIHLDLQFGETFHFGILSSPNTLRLRAAFAQSRICILDNDLLPLN